jgi:hypothetical protein
VNGYRILTPEGLRTARPHVGRTACCIALLAPGACAARINETTLDQSRAAFRVNARLLVALTDTSRNPDAIGRVYAVRATGDTILITDAANDRVILLDSAGRTLRAVGSRGHGPAELAGVTALAIRGTHFWVSEAINGRVSEFTLDGRYVRVYRAPFAAGSMTLHDSQPIVSIRSSRTYAARLLRDHTVHDVFVRRRAPSSGRWKRLSGHDLLASTSTTHWVFDQATASLCRFPDLKAADVCYRLPAALDRAIHDYRDHRVELFERATHQHVAAAPLAKDMDAAGDLLALLLPLPQLPIVIINTRDGVLTPVAIVGDTLPDWVRSATSFSWSGGGFVLAGDAGIGRLVPFEAERMP